MVKFSAGYNKINPNFVIQGLNESENSSPIFSIVQNILTRGCPTIPSRCLREKLGDPILTDDFKYYLNFENLYWDKTIKGGANSNPALKDYNNGFSDFWNIDTRYVGSFIPETSIQDIIYDYKSKKNVDSHVDFYSPIYRRVLEIDGGQHSEEEQNTKDTQRDQILKEHGVKVWRRKVSYEYTKQYDVEPIEEVVKCIDTTAPKFSDNEKGYLFAIRLELLLCSLYASGVVKLYDQEFKLNLHTDYQIGTALTQNIISDFYDLVGDVASLQGVKFNRPNVTINFCPSDKELSEQDGISVDISLLKVYCDSRYDNVYYIRNDYFLYEEKKYFTNDSDDTYWYKKNNYKISFNEVEYHLDIDEHRAPLTNLLRNTSLQYDDFRDNQLEIIIELLNNSSVIGVLPTGAGKSLCYQLCSLLIPSMTLVVAPLQLLMADQARNMERFFGMNNVAVVNAMSKYDQEIFKAKQALVTIVSPERFFSISFTDILRKMPHNKGVGFVVIDEVHCLSEWGHDFRTSYLCLSHNLGRYFPSTTYLMALTGTASHRVFEDVELELRNFKKQPINSIFAVDMRRNNLKVNVIKTNNYYNELRSILAPSISGSNAKVLVFTKKKTGSENRIGYDSACIPLMSRLAREYSTQNLGDKMAYYVGGNDLTSDEKIDVLNQFASGEKSVILATKAFGMGVDIDDIRTTIHYGIPSSVESLYQEMGRAGRDGLKSTCYVLYQEEDERVLRRFFRRPLMSIEEMKHSYRELKELQTNFYFIQNGNLDPQVESAFISLVLDMIKDLNSKGNSSKGINARTFMKSISSSGIDIDVSGDSIEKVRDLVEKAMYRLFLLGEIDMWSVVYEPSDISNPTYTDLRVTDLTDEQKLERLKKHITKYQTYFDLEDENTFQNRLLYLITWVNDNYLVERVQGIRTVYNQCAHFSTSENFMNFIANYFSNDPLYNRLIEYPTNLSCWIDAIKAPPAQTRDRLSRLLESYDQFGSLNYVSGITRLRLDEFDDPDGRPRLESAFADIEREVDDKDRQMLFTRTYNIIEAEVHDVFVQAWIDHFPEDAKHIYRTTLNKIAEQYLITSYLKEILELGGEFNGKLR